MSDEQNGGGVPTGLEDFPEPSETAGTQAPTLPPEFARADPNAVARTLAEQERQLAQPAGNLDAKGAPHFLRNVNGEEVCGQDGQPWPCDEWQGIAHRGAVLETGGERSSMLPTMVEAAQAAGMDLAEFEARLRQTRGQ